MPLTCLAILLLFFPIPAARAQRQPAVSIRGETARVRVPMVSEPWSATQRVTAPDHSRPRQIRFIGHFPGFKAAKQRANQRAAHERPPRQAESGATRPMLSLALQAPAASTLVFDGPSESDTNVIPPDPQIAAGPTYLVAVINSLMAIYDKTGNQQGGFQQLSTFFGSLALTGEFFDPRIIYDQTDQRFILTAGEIDFTGLTNGHVVIAVSDTSDPTQTWHKWALNFMGRDASNTEDTFPDFPGLGLSNSAVYITTNQFELTQACLTTDTEGCYFSDAQIKVIGLPELLAGNPNLNITSFTKVQTADGFPAFAIQPALTYGSSSNEYLVAARFDNYVGSALDLFAIPTSGTPTLTTADTGVPPYQFPSDAPQEGGTEPISTNDFRPLNAVWANGSFFCAHNVGGSGGVAARWYQITLSALSSASLAQSGDVTGSGDAYYPAISLQADGSVGMAFTTSSQYQFASSAFTAREASDPLGAMRSYSVYRAGTKPYDELFGSRWGDYSGISEDPDGNSLWMITEYAGTPDPHFGTAVVQFTTPPALTVSPSALNFGPTLVGQSSSPMTVTVTNISGSSVTLGTAVMGGPNAADYSISSDECSGQTIAANQTCAIALTFKPSVQESEDASLFVSYAGSEFITVGTTGFGMVEAVITFSPSATSFPPTTVGAASPPQTITLTNTGNESTTAFSLSIAGPFTQTNNCTTALVPGASCQASVVFHPVSGGASSGGLAVQWNAPGAPNTLLSGLGVTAPAVLFCPPSLNFPSEAVNTASGAEPVIVTNNGSSVLTVTGISTSGDFSEVNNCPGTLPPLGNCVVNVTFSPTATGSRSGLLKLTDDAPASPQTLSLTGTGAAIATNFPGLPSEVVSVPHQTGALPLAVPGVAATEAATHAVDFFTKRPLAFEQNEGQFNPGVEFIAHSQGHSVAIITSGVAFTLESHSGGSTSPQRVARQPVSPRRRDILSAAKNLRTPERQSETRVTNALVHMTLVGQNPNASFSGSGELPGKTNYFIGNDPSRWRTSVPTYSQVKLQRVYPGIDLVYYGNQNRLEYDFVVAPHSSPAAIRLKFEGQRRLRIDAKSGDLVLETRAGEVRLHKPLVYQAPKAETRESKIETRRPANQKSPIENRQSVEGRYVLLAANQVGFAVGNYDKARPLVIDPVLSFSTYLAGTDYDSINGIAVDASGNVYVTGFTYSQDFPVTPDSFQQSCVQSFEQCFYPYGGSNAFVSKLSPDGSTLIYSTYLGGGAIQQEPGIAYNEGNAIAVDSAGDAFVGGITTATNFPVTSGAFQTQCKTSSTAGCDSAFVTKLNPSGSALVYSTYLGGTPGPGSPFNSSSGPGGTQPNGLAIDSAGDAYVAGSTGATDFPTTPGALEPTIQPPVPTSVSGPPTHGFLVELNPSASNLVYSTFLGGTTNDTINGIARDAEGNVYVAGITASVDFPTTPGALQPGPYVLGLQSTAYVYNGFLVGFVTKFDPTWKLLYSTYYSQSPIQGLAADSAGSAYVAGPSPYFGSAAGFAAKLHPQGCGLLYSVPLPGGPPPNDNTFTAITVPTAIAVDGSGDAYVIGKPFIYTNYGAGTQPVNPLQTPTLGNVFVGEIDPKGTSFPFWTTLGGSGGDSPNAVATDSQGNVYVAGQTGSADFPTTPGAFQPDCPACGSNGGTSGSDHQAVGGFVTKISAGNPTGVSLTRSELTFLSSLRETQAVGLLNGSTVPLAISSVAVSGSRFSLGPNSASPCSGTIAPGEGCSVYVSFQPGASGVFAGTLTITDSGAASPRVIALDGVSGPPFTLTATPQFSGNPLAGTDSLNYLVSAPAIAGVASLPGGVYLSCTPYVTCTASPATVAINGQTTLTASGFANLINNLVAGQVADTISFTLAGDYGGQSASMPITVDFADFVLTSPLQSVTVTAGWGAKYSIDVSPVNGLSGNVTFNCDAPTTPMTCAVSPSNVSVDGTSQATATVTVTTTAPSSSVGPSPMNPLPWKLAPERLLTEWLLLALGLMTLHAGAQAARKRRLRWTWLGLPTTLLVLVLWASCGGGGSGSVGGGSGSVGGGGGNSGTPTGNYAITVTGTYASGSSTLTRNIIFSLTVQ